LSKTHIDSDDDDMEFVDAEVEEKEDRIIEKSRVIHRRDSESP
jgi:hypothetical protein